MWSAISSVPVSFQAPCCQEHAEKIWPPDVLPLLLRHAADEASMHTSLKERKNLRDSHSPAFLNPLSSYIFLPLSLISADSAPHRVFILRRPFPSELQTFPAIICFFLVWPTSQSGIDGDTEGRGRRGSIRAQRATKQPRAEEKERKLLKWPLRFSDWKSRSSLMEQRRSRQLTVSCRWSLTGLQPLSDNPTAQQASTALQGLHGDYSSEARREYSGLEASPPWQPRPSRSP